jgi:hypothetical protein
MDVTCVVSHKCRPYEAFHPGYQHEKRKTTGLGSTDNSMNKLHGSEKIKRHAMMASEDMEVKLYAFVSPVLVEYEWAVSCFGLLCPLKRQSPIIYWVK